MLDCNRVSWNRAQQKAPRWRGFSIIQKWAKDTLVDRCGAGCRNRTDDLLITNQLLYQLS
jgi:hypothetical protein